MTVNKFKRQVIVRFTKHTTLLLQKKYSSLAKMPATSHFFLTPNMKLSEMCYTSIIIFNILLFLYAKTASAVEFLSGRECLPTKEQIQKNSEDSQSNFYVCTKASMSLYGAFISNGKLALLDYEQLYSGAHISRYMSFHLNGSHERAHDYPNKILNFENAQLDLGSVQIGNPATDKFWINAGLQPAPFGFNKNPFSEFTSYFDPKYFWQDPHLGIKLSFDNQSKLSWENEISTHKSFKDLLSNQNDYLRLSSRIMYDLAIFHGTRMIYSLMSEASGKRQVGFSILNTSPDRNLFSLEWIRFLTTPDGKQDPFEQLIRVAYEDSINRKSRVLILYDDIFMKSRLFGLGTDYRIIEHLNSRFALFFKKDETLKNYYWFFILGLNAYL